MPKGYTSQKGVIYSEVIRDMAEDPNFLNEEVRGRLSRMRYREQEYLGGNVENILLLEGVIRRGLFLTVLMEMSDDKKDNVIWLHDVTSLEQIPEKVYTDSKGMFRLEENKANLLPMKNEVLRIIKCPKPNRRYIKVKNKGPVTGSFLLYCGKYLLVFKANADSLNIYTCRLHYLYSMSVAQK